LTQELWKGGEVHQKRAEIRSLIETLSVEWESQRSNEARAKAGTKAAERAIEKPMDKVVEKPIEIKRPIVDKTETIPTKRRKQEHPKRLKVIEIE
jgi:arsenate reductase-like glutaredoxin family protein